MGVKGLANFIAAAISPSTHADAAESQHHMMTIASEATSAVSISAFHFCPG